MKFARWQHQLDVRQLVFSQVRQSAALIYSNQILPRDRDELAWVAHQGRNLSSYLTEPTFCLSDD